MKPAAEPQSTAERWQELLFELFLYALAALALFWFVEPVKRNRWLLILALFSLSTLFRFIRWNHQLLTAGMFWALITGGLTFANAALASLAALVLLGLVHWQWRRPRPLMPWALMLAVALAAWPATHWLAQRLESVVGQSVQK